MSTSNREHGLRLKRIEADVKTIKILLTGNGNPSKGIIVRLDRLEQTARVRRWLNRTIGVALIGTLIELARLYFFKS